MTTHYEAEVIVGIEDIAINEIKTIDGVSSESVKKIRDGFIRFEYSHGPEFLHDLKSVIAVYAIHYFEIPRPKALLGHQNFTRLINIISRTISHWKSEHLTLGLGAAGSDSSVMIRIKDELSVALNIPVDDEEKGKLHIRMIPAHKKSGWDILVRLTSTPLSTRNWRVKNIPGALNATVAYAMVQLARITSNNRIVNLCGGTATILIELAKHIETDMLYSIDNNHEMLNMASVNIAASQTHHRITQIQAEAQQTPFQTGSVQCIFADLPFGHHVGSHEENEWLYPAILDESARIAAKGAIFVAVTHEIQLMQQTLLSSHWAIRHQRKINLSGLHPQIFVLERI